MTDQTKPPRSVHALEVGRGIAIVSVMYGHALAPWFMDGAARFNADAFIQWKFGASFMMPFFFLLSGAGWRADASLLTTLRKSVTLVLIAWLASVALDLARLGMTETGVAATLGLAPLDAGQLIRNAARTLVFGDHYSMSALWFLAALALVRLLGALSLRLGMFAVAGVALVLLLANYAANQDGWRNIHQVQLLGVAFASFMAGHYARGVLDAMQRSLPIVIGVLLTAGAATVFTFDLNQGCTWEVGAVCGDSWLSGRFGVAMIIGHFGNLPLFALTSATGAAFALALAVLVTRAAWLGERFAIWGRSSLDLLIVNCIFLELANPLVSRFIAPRIAADSGLFFAVLLTVVLTLNLTALTLLRRPLKLLRRTASELVRFGLDLAARPIGWAGRGLRVSLRHD
jgi:hypothetical protein